MNLLGLLQEKGVIDADTAARLEAQIADGMQEEKAFLEAGIDLDTIRQHVGAYYDLPAESIPDNIIIDPSVMRYIPEESARHYKMVPLRVEDGILVVGVVDPEDYGLREALNFITTKFQLPYRLVVILNHDLEHAFKSYENLTGEVDTALNELRVELDMDDKEGDETAPEDPQHIKEDAPVTKIVATVLRYAVDGSASDIHIEPYETKTVVRFRVDGILARSLELPKKVHSAVVARVKILASLRLDEKRKPQDGRFSATVDGRKIDFRVSVLPTSHGEKVVMRILDTKTGVRTLEETGVSPYNVKLIREAIRQPYGIILISGPTGSGKSTTLYAMLSEVDREGRNVLSLEDPVEYNIEGVSQSQVRPEIGYTFATGLRSALRQDPDVIMVGEIRDKETAQLAIQAALTGHLVLSTIHTNNALGVVPRLIDMGVDPYLIAPTLQLALAQRLVRRICPGTGKEIPIEGSIQMMMDHLFKDLPDEYKELIPESDHVLQAESTAGCTSGTKGRVAVMEAVPITEEIRKLILKNGGEAEYYQVARKNGFISMKEDAIIKALNGVIPFEEVNTLGGEFVATDGEDDLEAAPAHIAAATAGPETAQAVDTAADIPAQKV
jgi:type IV pilus assembly protein PilB